jgi:uncharacterized protein (DUF2147 family)
MKRALTLLSGFIAMIMLMSAADTPADRIIGKWYTAENKSIVRIYKATDSKYYGKIVWLKNPLDENNKPKVDDQNPNAELRTKPIIDLLIMRGFVYEGNDIWWNGTIYDPDNGSTYKCKITLQTNNHIFVRGYIGKEWMGLGRTTDWNRVQD